MKQKIETQYGYIHVRTYDDSRRSWIRARSERHAMRLARMLGWYDINPLYCGMPYQHVHYDETAKRLIKNSGWG